MAARRHPTAPVDALDRRVDLNDLGARATAGLTRWVLGTGLLWLHALAFVVVGLGMLLRNILTDPADITVGEPLLRWGIVLVGHAAAVAIGWTVWRVAHPPTRRPAYHPVPRRALAAGRPAPLMAEPVWYPNASANGHANGHDGQWKGHANGASPNGAANGHLPQPAGAWPAQGPARTIVTSRRVTTLVVATARDGLASARRRYRREAQPPAQNPNDAHPEPAWAGGAPAQQPTGTLPPTNGTSPSHTPSEQPATGWNAAYSRDEVISVTQVGADPTQGLGERPAGEADDTDPVRSWLDGYLDGQGREREARWTWVEAAASTWLARGEETQPALAATADPSPPGSDDDRRTNVGATGQAAPARGNGRTRDATPDIAGVVPNQPPTVTNGPDGSPA